MSRLIGGLVAGALLGLLQHRLLVHRHRRSAALLIAGHILLWTALLGVSGGQRSPLFAAYLLEVAMAGALFSRSAAWITGAGALAAFVARAWWLDPPVSAQALALVAGFIAIGALLTSVLADLHGRQTARLREYHAALQHRASTLAEELQLLGDYLGSGLIVLDPVGRVVSANAACARLLGIPGDLKGQPWQVALALDGSDAGHLLGAIDLGQPERGLLLHHERPDGRVIPLRAEIWHHLDADGRRTFLLLAEAQTTRTEEDPLHRLGEAVACVAHQFRNSVQALHGFAGDLLAVPMAAGPEREHIRGLLGVVDGLAELSRDVLAMAGPAASAPEDLSVCEILRSSASLARSHRVLADIELPPTELKVRARRGPLVHAFFNLIDNACRVSPPGERPRVTVACRADRVGIFIDDRGPGMPAHLPAGNSPDPRAQGAGYGLVAARRFIEGAGGDLSFSARSDGGTSCLVWLPAAGSSSPER